MNFPFELPGNPNKEIQIMQLDYSNPDLVRSRCQSKTIQTKDLSDNLDIGWGYAQLICNQKRSGLDKLISKQTLNIRIFVIMPSSILKLYLAVKVILWSLHFKIAKAVDCKSESKIWIVIYWALWLLWVTNP